VDARHVGSVRAAVARAPHADAFDVDLRLRFEPRNGVADVVHLLERHESPLRPLAAAVTAVVERKYGVAGRREALRIVGQNHTSDAAVAVAEDDAGPALTRFDAGGKEVVSLEA